MTSLHRRCRTFLSTPSGWRATDQGHQPPHRGPNFYPRPPGGGRLSSFSCIFLTMYFYPRPPGGGRPKQVIFTFVSFEFLSTPSGWRATLISFADRLGKIDISIHALRVEGDGVKASWEPVQEDFYPRPPGGGRRCSRKCQRRRKHFYPRPPGGGRLCPIDSGGGFANFYPRPPGGGRRHKAFANPSHFGCISIHALRVEGD